MAFYEQFESPLDKKRRQEEELAARQRANQIQVTRRGGGRGTTQMVAQQDAAAQERARIEAITTPKESPNPGDYLVELPDGRKGWVSPDGIGYLQGSNQDIKVTGNYKGGTPNVFDRAVQNFDAGLSHLGGKAQSALSDVTSGQDVDFQAPSVGVRPTSEILGSPVSPPSVPGIPTVNVSAPSPSFTPGFQANPNTNLSAPTHLPSVNPLARQGLREEVPQLPVMVQGTNTAADGTQTPETRIISPAEREAAVQGVPVPAPALPTAPPGVQETIQQNVIETPPAAPTAPAISAPPGRADDGRLATETDINQTLGGQDTIRAQQQELAGLLLDRAKGQGPSAAQDLLQKGQDSAMRQAMALSRAQTGVSSGAALRQGLAAGQDLQRQALADAGMLRAQEQQQAAQQATQALFGVRGQDISVAELQSKTALTEQAQALQQQGMSLQDAQFRMAQDQQEKLARMGFAVDLEKLRVVNEQVMAGMNLQVALANAGFDAQMTGAWMQLAGLGLSAVL